MKTIQYELFRDHPGRSDSIGTEFRSYPTALVPQLWSLASLPSQLGSTLADAGGNGLMNPLTSRNRSGTRFLVLSRYIPANYVQADALAPLDRFPKPPGPTRILLLGGETDLRSRQTGERGYFLTDFGCYELKRELIGYHLTS